MSRTKHNLSVRVHCLPSRPRGCWPFQRYSGSPSKLAERKPRPGAQLWYTRRNGETRERRLLKRVEKTLPVLARKIDSVSHRSQLRSATTLYGQRSRASLRQAHKGCPPTHAHATACRLGLVEEAVEFGPSNPHLVRSLHFTSHDREDTHLPRYQIWSLHCVTMRRASSRKVTTIRKRPMAGR